MMQEKRDRNPSGEPYFGPMKFFLSCLLLLAVIAVFSHVVGRPLPIVPEPPDMTFVDDHRSGIDRAHRMITSTQSELASLRRQLADLEEKVAGVKSCECKPAEVKATEPPAPQVFTIPIIVPFVQIIRQEKIIHVPAPPPEPKALIRLEEPLPLVMWECYPPLRRRR